MSTTQFTDGVSLTAASWFNDVDTATYSYLTSVSGTNTIAATGPANLAYAAGQVFRFIPAATNTGATTLNITPSGASALGAKNVFCNGAACTGGELVSGVPAVVIYDGTQFNIQAGKLSRKVVSFTIDSSTASGTQAVTGVGFKPTSIRVIMGVSGGGSRASIGMSDGSSEGCVYNAHNTSANTWGTASNLIYADSGVGTNYAGVISSFDADGFTISWTKTGSPTGTLVLYAECFR